MFIYRPSGRAPSVRRRETREVVVCANVNFAELPLCTKSASRREWLLFTVRDLARLSDVHSIPGFSTFSTPSGHGRTPETVTSGQNRSSDWCPLRPVARRLGAVEGGCGPVRGGCESVWGRSRAVVKRQTGSRRTPAFRLLVPMPPSPGFLLYCPRRSPPPPRLQPCTSARASCLSFA